MIFSCPSSPPGVCLTGSAGSTGRRGCSNTGPRARWRAWRERSCLIQSCDQSITSSHNSCTPKAGMCYKIFKSSVVWQMRLCIHSKCSFSAVRVKGTNLTFPVRVFGFLLIVSAIYVRLKEKEVRHLLRVNLPITQLFKVYLLWVNSV